MKSEIKLLNSYILLEGNDDCSKDAIVLFLPGVSGKAFSERFQPLVDLCKELNFPIARISAWDGVTDVNKGTWSQYHRALDEVIEHIPRLNYTKVIAVGKSFGGGLFLSYHHTCIEKKILWAPAIGVGKEEMFALYKNRVLAEIPSFLDIQMSEKFIREDLSAIYIIHGTKDTYVPIENSQKIINIAKNGDIAKIENADHSFSTPEEEKGLMDATRFFLRKEI